MQGEQKIMSDSFEGSQSEHDGAESNVDTLSKELQEPGFDEETADEAADLMEEEDDEDDSDDDAEQQKGTGSKSARAAKTAARPKAAAQFGWSDVESILNFVTRFNSATPRERDALKAVFGVPAKADAFGTAQALHAGSAHLAVYKDVSAFIDTIIKGKFDLTAVFGLISDLSKRDDDYVRDFFRSVNAFLTEEVRYRKNAPLPTLLEPLIVNATKSLSEADRKTLKWIDETLSVWPK
jgi:hypothetical protein